MLVNLNEVLLDAKKGGYVRVRVDGNMYDLSEEIILDKNKKHNLLYLLQLME